MRGRLRWIALAAGAYVAFVVSLFPAATALRWFAPAELRVAGVEGTIWSGSAALASMPGLALRDLRWTIDRLPLVLGRLAGELSARLPNGFVAARFAASPWAVRFRDVQLSTSLDSLADLLPVSGASALISAQIETLELRDGWPTELLGQVRVSDLLVEPYFGGGDGLMALGSHEIQLQETGDGTLTGAIRDLGGPLEIDASLRLMPTREYVLEGRLLARAGAPQMLLQGIDFMTSDPDDTGRRHFMLTGSL